MYVARLPNNRRNVTRCRVSNSRSNTKITRIILLAGALVAVLLLASVERDLAHAQTNDNNLPAETIDYAEGGTAPVAGYTAVDPEGESIVWTVTGPDNEAFTIDGGVLTFNSTPNYENPDDSDENNTYSVTVTASDGSSDRNDTTQDITVNIVNLDEPGTVTLSARQPQVGNALTAMLTDPDGQHNVTPPGPTIADQLDRRPHHMAVGQVPERIDRVDRHRSGDNRRRLEPGRQHLHPSR